MATYYRWEQFNAAYDYSSKLERLVSEGSSKYSTGAAESSSIYYKIGPTYSEGFESFDKNTGTFKLDTVSKEGQATSGQSLGELFNYGAVTDRDHIIIWGPSADKLCFKENVFDGYADISVRSSGGLRIQLVAGKNNVYYNSYIADETPTLKGDISYGYVYSLSPDAYPNGISESYYYVRTTVESPTAPSGLSYPATITTPSVDVTWTAATSNVPDYPVSGYQVDVSTNGGSSWTLAGNPNTNSLTYSITPGVTSIMFRVRAKDSNGQWGSYVTGTASQVLLAPTLTVPQMLMQGQQATVNWTAIEGADSYTLQRKANTDTDWTQVYSGTALTFSETVGTWTSVQYRVQAVFDETPGGWATSAEIPVVSASALVISGQDGDLGTLVNDVPYSISTDTGNQITATITVNGSVIFNGTVGNSTADVIPVLDLISGEGTIVIEASVTASSGPVSAVRTWTYTKTLMTFPNAGSIAELTKDGKVMWPETLANAVRLPGGKTLDQVMAFPAQIFTGSYVGTGTFGEDNPVEITFPFVPNIWWIFGETDTDGQYTAQNDSIPVPWGKTNLMLNADLTASYSGSTVSFYRSNYPTYNEQGKVYSFLGIKIG